MFPITGSISHINYSTRMATTSLSLPILLRIHCMPSPACNVPCALFHWFLPGVWPAKGNWSSVLQTACTRHEEGILPSAEDRERKMKVFSLSGLLSERGDRKVFGQHQSIVQTNNRVQGAVRRPINLHLGCWGGVIKTSTLALTLEYQVGLFWWGQRKTDNRN